jgi:RHS repeat-associated protein
MAPGGDRYLQTSDTLRLVYGPRGLEKETVSSGGGSNSRIGAAAQASPVGTRWRHELGPVSVVREGGVDTVHTILRDRIGSTTSVAAANQTLSATRQFDPFGQPREGDQQDRSYLDLAPATLRGFTEHEHLSNGLIHMNGRVYDPKVGRFLSVDPIIQFPSNSQSLNPYSYILNNPFAGTDPSGYASCSVGENFASSECSGAGNHKIFDGDGAYLGGLKVEKGSGGGRDTISFAPTNAGWDFANGAKAGQGTANEKQGAASDRASVSSRSNNPTVGDRVATAPFALGVDPNDERLRSRSEELRDNIIGFFFGVGDAGYVAPEGSGEVTPASMPFGMDAVIYRALRISSAIVNATKGTGTVWDSIKATQEVWPGTLVPRSFELAAGKSRVWVHGNATEHLAEYAISMANRGVSTGLVRIGTQQQLRSLQSAVEAATTNGMTFNRLMTVGGWELKFAAPRAKGQLPALIHALPVP